MWEEGLVEKKDIGEGVDESKQNALYTFTKLAKNKLIKIYSKKINDRLELGWIEELVRSDSYMDFVE